MKVTSVPAYAYFSGQSKRCDIFLLQSNNVIAKLKETTPGTNIQSWQNVSLSDLQIVNDFFGDNILNPHFTCYMAWSMNAAYNNLSNHPEMTDYMLSLQSMTNIHLEMFEVPLDIDLSSDSVSPSKWVCLNNDELGTAYVGASRTIDTTPTIRAMKFYAPQMAWPVSVMIDTVYRQIKISLMVLSEQELFNSQVFNDTPAYRDSDMGFIDINCIFEQQDDKLVFTQVDIIHRGVGPSSSNKQSIADFFANFHTAKSGINDFTTDPDDPYGINGNSAPGGGDGTLNARGLDAVDPAEIPNLPSVSAANLGFITMYNPTAAELQSLADFMWSNLFDLNTYKKLFSDPMESIIGLSIVPINPSIGGTKNVQFGTIDSGISMSFLSTNWASLDCGWCSIEKYIGAFLDSDPYTKVSLYLPFIGIRQLSADDVNGRMIHVVYHVDVLTGACAAFVEVEGRGVLYTYNGSCITNVPLTSVNFSGAIQNAVSAVISGIGTVAGMATGAAPVTAMGVAGLLNSAANTALNSKPAVQRSGNLGGSAGIMSIMRPYLIIERPNISVPNNVQHYTGQTCNMTMYLGACSGFTMCEFVHVENVPATTEEVKEIEALLKEGVYL